MRSLSACIILCLVHNFLLSQGYTMPAEIPFDQVQISGNIHLELVASDKPLLLFEGDTVPEQLNVSWSEGVMALKTRTELKQAPSIELKLYHPGPSGLEITRGAVVQSADILSTSTLTLRMDTGGKAEFEVSTDSLSARLNQGSDIILSGTTRSQNIVANTVANYHGYELEAERTWVKASTGAQVKVNTTDNLDAHSTSGAFVGYKGSPAHTAFKTNTGGKITPENQ